MGHHHVPEGPGALVEAGPGVHREGLGDVDLDVVDVVAVPDGLEEPVGEPEGQDVLGRLLPQEVVDPVDLLGGEDPVDGVVEHLGRLQVGAERLLHDDPGPLDQVGLAEGAGPRRGRPRAGCSGSGGAGSRPPSMASARCHRLGQGARPVRLGDEVEAGLEAGPVAVHDVLAGELAAGLAGRSRGSRPRPSPPGRCR